MIERAIVPFLFVFLCSLTRISLDVQASTIPEESITPSVTPPVTPTRDNASTSPDFNGTRGERQTGVDENDIDVDGPYGYIPRVVNGVNKIVKGLLKGSMHSVFHGAFGIAPDDISDDLIESYNRVFGIADPEDLPERAQRPKVKTTKAPETLTNSTATPTPILSKEKKSSKDEEEDDEDLDEDDERK